MIQMETDYGSDKARQRKRNQSPEATAATPGFARPTSLGHPTHELKHFYQVGC